MPGTLAPVVVQTFTDTNGRPLSGARLYSFLAGTTTPAPVYADVALAVPLSNPAIADSSGRLTFYLAPTSYKFELRTADDASVWIRDNVPATPANEIDLDVQGVAGETLAARDVVFLSNGTGGTTAGRWYKTDADIVARSTGANIVGMVPTAVGAGAAGAVRLQGRLTGFSGLTPGAAYYISGVAGALTDTPPVNARFIALSDTTTSLVMTIAGVAQAQPTDPVFNTVQVSGTAVNALDVAGGIQAGTGNVQVVDATGKIPAIDATHFASLSGANLTALNGSTVSTGTVPDARLSSNVELKNTAATVTGDRLYTGAGPVGFKAPAATAIAVRLIGRTGDSLSILDATDESQLSQYMQAAISTGGLTLFAPGAGSGVITFGTPVVPTRINSGSAQPGFLAYSSTGTLGVASGATVQFDTEVYDTVASFASSTFTAPLSGIYLLSVTVGVSFAGASSVLITIVTSNRSYVATTTYGGSVSMSVFADMDAGDTAFVRINHPGLVVNISSASPAYAAFFSGRLAP